MYKLLAAALVLSCGGANATNGLTVKLTPSLAPGQPVGVPVTWNATVSGAVSSPLYRFLVASQGGPWSVVRDLSDSSTLTWTTLQEGWVQVAVVAMDPGTGAQSQAVNFFKFVTRIVDGVTPAVSGTAHPLVAIYSAPPCSSGSVRVQFRAVGDTFKQTTPAQNCEAGKSLNFYIAGMRANTIYAMQQLSSVIGSVPGPVLQFQTGTPSLTLPAFAVLSPPGPNTSFAQRILLMSFYAFVPNRQIGPVATDLSGRLLWYEPDLVNSQQADSYLVRPAPGGTMLLVMGSSAGYGQLLREVDLAGNLVRETNVQRLNQQLVAVGKAPISWLAHEALRLANGHTLILGATERLLTNVQGPGTVDVLGDTILDLDANFQVTWTWSAFDFLDPSRPAVLGETCTSNSHSCGQLQLATVANDWTHSNSIAYLPADGNLLLSVRHQDWVVKIGYRKGAGPGNILWRLGNGGAFTTDSTDPYPWFTHQHDVGFDGTNLELYDNGNTRVAQTGGGDSRGQVWSLDEVNRIAHLLLNVDVGVYTQAFGSAQRLSNGNYSFLSGLLIASGPTLSSQALEVLPDGTTSMNLSWQANAYRAFRLRDLYSYFPYKPYH